MAKKDLTKMGQNSVDPAIRKMEKKRRHKAGRQSVKQDLKKYTY